MNNPTRIYVVRHAQSRFNAGVDTQDLNASLTNLGIEQAKKIAQEFKDINFVAIFASSLNRSKETADIIKNGRDLPIVTNGTTNERSFYQYSRKIKREEVELEEEMMNEIIKLPEKSKMGYKHSPEMESAEEGAIRLLNLLREISKDFRGKNVLVASHGNLMRSILTFLGYAKYDELPTGSVKNTAYFVLETDGQNFNVVETHNIEKQKGVIRVW